jgi:redox-sensitive bicupin YhaK (pirin superfamily)
MTLTLRPADARGHANHGWLASTHTFSFADYFDPAHMGFRALRVINDDVIQPQSGFGLHGHRDMEIITYLVAGTLEHRATLRGHGLLRPGDVQYMSAGTGIRHSEVNPSESEPVRLLQIWIEPPALGLPPAYTQIHVPDAAKHNRLCRIAGPAGGDGLVTHRDMSLFAARLDPGCAVTHTLRQGRAAWVQVVAGAIDFGPVPLGPGDGAAIEGVSTLTLTARSAAEILLFDLD